MSDIQLVIFDMAGTAIDEDNVVYKTLAAAIEKYGFELTLDLVLLHGAGKEKRQAIVDILAILVSEPLEAGIVDTIYLSFKNMLAEAYETHPMSVFKGVQTILSQLRERGVKIAFNTGYQREVAEHILRRVGLSVGADIDLLVTATDVTAGRPAPDMINLACDRLGVAARHSIKVGDSAIDIEEGRNAGVALAIGVTTGAQTRAQLEAAQPDAVIDDMIDILPMLERV